MTIKWLSLLTLSNLFKNRLKHKRNWILYALIQKRQVKWMLKCTQLQVIHFASKKTVRIQNNSDYIPKLNSHKFLETIKWDATRHRINMNQLWKFSLLVVWTARTCSIRLLALLARRCFAVVIILKLKSRKRHQKFYLIYIY